MLGVRRHERRKGAWAERAASASTVSSTVIGVKRRPAKRISGQCSGALETAVALWEPDINKACRRAALETTPFGAILEYAGSTFTFGSRFEAVLKSAQAIKRLMDIGVSAVLLALLAPLLLLIAVLVKLTSKGSVFYACRWVGQGERPFTGYKFRSPTAHREAETAKAHRG